jgi:hypothetical protein
MRRGPIVICIAATLSLLAAPAADATVTPGCSAVPLAKAATANSTVCVHAALVTETTNAQEQNVTTFTVEQGSDTLTARIGHWWPQGPPTAGMVVTMWGQPDGGTFRVDRWIETTHGTGPYPAGPYRLERLVDVSSGRIPEHRMVWVRAVTFLLDPQNGGDGDIHVQTLSPCPAAGLTTETTPPLRGYVDHPKVPGLVSSTREDDAPSSHLADAPPLGVPVMILGATRYDYGFGWWELHPIRAWRFLTAKELLAQARECAADPVPHIDRTGPSVAGHHLPIPFGVPPCTDGSEFGTNPFFTGCPPQCYVTHTAIGQPEQLSDNCEGIQPRSTPSQTTLAGRLLDRHRSATLGRVRALSRETEDAEEGADGEAEIERVAQRTFQGALEGAYGTGCASAKARAGAYRTCLDALARIAGGETASPRRACHVAGRARLDADARLCVAAARRYTRRLRALPIR